MVLSGSVVKEPLRGVEPFSYNWKRIAMVVIQTLAEGRIAGSASKRAISRAAVSLVGSRQRHLRESMALMRSTRLTGGFIPR